MNLGEMRKRVAQLINFKSGTPDQDFDGTDEAPWSHIDQLINEAYEDEYETAIINCGRSAFAAIYDATWAAGEQTFNLPSFIETTHISAIYDATSGASIPAPLLIGDRLSHDLVLVWAGPRTLEWRPSGPPAAKVLRFDYARAPALLAQESDEPSLFPQSTHKLLCWSAATIGKTEAGDKVPAQWAEIMTTRRFAMIKLLSANRPALTGPDRMESFS